MIILENINKELDSYITDCNKQIEIAKENNMENIMISSDAMAKAYKICKNLIQKELDKSYLFTKDIMPKKNKKIIGYDEKNNKYYLTYTNEGLYRCQISNSFIDVEILKYKYE